MNNYLVDFIPLQFLLTNFGIVICINVPLSHGYVPNTYMPSRVSNEQLSVFVKDHAVRMNMVKDSGYRCHILLIKSCTYKISSSGKLIWMYNQLQVFIIQLLLFIDSHSSTEFNIGLLHDTQLNQTIVAYISSFSTNLDFPDPNLLIIADRSYDNPFIPLIRSIWIELSCIYI